VTYEIARFGFKEMMECRSRVRALFDDQPATTEQAAQRTVDFFYSEFVDDEGKPACALVRFFKTHLFANLDDELRKFAVAIAPESSSIPDLRCLTLMATAGDLPEWNSRHQSRGHRAIPLTSVDVVEQAPMISQMIRQMGIEISSVVRPDPALLLDRGEANYDVFYVEKALGSPHIVAQREFVERYGIESVLGFGGLLATGDLFAVILFSKVRIPPSVAEQFKVIGLNFKIAVLPLARKPLFDRRTA
jgi:two-component system NtrC family sensor kinase